MAIISQCGSGIYQGVIRVTNGLINVKRNVFYKFMCGLQSLYMTAPSE